MSVSREGKKNNRKVKGTKALNTLFERWIWGVFNYIEAQPPRAALPVAQKPLGRQFQTAKYTPEIYDFRTVFTSEEGWKGSELGTLQLFL